MIKIFSTDKVRELDRYTIEYEPIDSIDLVERAATAFTGEFCRHFNKQMRVVVFAGQGKQRGGCVGRCPAAGGGGYRVESYLFNPTSRLSPDCEQNRNGCFN